MYMCLFRIEVKFPITFYSNDWLINQGKNGACAVSDEMYNFFGEDLRDV